jgi:hypothetical protein
MGVLPSLDATLVGWHPSSEDQAVLDTVLPGPRQATTHTGLFGGGRFGARNVSAHSGGTASERLCRALDQFPRHYLRTIGTCVLPALVGMVPILTAGLHAKRMVADLPHIAATYDDFEKLSEVRSGISLALEGVKSFLGTIVHLAMVVAVLLALVSSRIVLPSIRIVVPVCCVCAVTLGQLNIFMAPATGSTLFWNIVQLSNVIVVLAVAWLARSIGRRVGDGTFWWKFILFYFVYYIVLLYTNNFIIEKIPSMSDENKVVHVAIVIPIIFELELTVQRLIVRSFSEHHESAAWVLLSQSLATKSAFSRFMVATIRSSGFTFLCALHFPLGSEDWRDRQLYRLIKRCCGTTQPEGTSAVDALSPDLKFDDPTRHWRNISLRERCMQHGSPLYLPDKHHMR